MTLGAYFFHKNNYLWEACIFMRQLEAFVYQIAASHISQDLLFRIMTSFMSGQDYDEELKIDIANAIGNGELGINGEDYNIVD